MLQESDVQFLWERIEPQIRAVARAEIASLAGLVLSRTSEEHFTRSIERNTAEDVVADRLAAIFGEALADFSGHTGGQEPGE